MMEITKTIIYRVNKGKLLAYATVTINDSIVISGIRLYEGDNRRFISFPSRTSKKGRKFDVAFPCKDEMREMILKEIEFEYLNEVLK